jgi:NAD(P)-dependent dehydrogenase (short-subunit alcohol dehydrogenase family)
MKKCLIIGSSKGIGLEIAHQLGKEYELYGADGSRLNICPI